MSTFTRAGARTADINSLSTLTAITLHHTATRSHETATTVPLITGVNVLLVDRKNHTPLHLAARWNRTVDRRGFSERAGQWPLTTALSREVWAIRDHLDAAASWCGCEHSECYEQNSSYQTAKSGHPEAAKVVLDAKAHRAPGPLFRTGRGGHRGKMRSS